ncbi:MAG: glycosyltransferase family 4 protein [Candidatus Kapaibacteriales bacterium]
MVEENSKRLNILFWRVDDYGALKDAGYSTLIQRLTNEFLRLQHNVFYFTGGVINLPKEVKSHLFPFSKLLRNLPEVFAMEYHFRSTRKAIKTLRKINQIDFIYQLIYNFNFSGAITSLKFGFPFFLQVDGILQWIKKHWGKSYFRFLLRLAEEIQWKSADRIFTISNVVKELLIQHGVYPQKIIVNPCGFDPEIFHPDIKADNLRDELDLRGKFVVGFSGTFGHYHGITYLAESMKYVVKRIPNAVFLYVGDGEVRPQLDEIIRRDNLKQHTRITGFQPFIFVPKYLSICDVLVSPCINNEDGTEFFNSPLKNFEYMGLRKPIIATAVGQQKEIFQHKYNALLVEERKPKAIAEAIIEIYENPQLAREIAQNAYLDGIQNHTWKHRAEVILREFWKLKNLNDRNK